MILCFSPHILGMLMELCWRVLTRPQESHSVITTKCFSFRI